MQISTAVLFAFVEGKFDRSFYSQLCDRVCSDSVIPYDLIISKELPGGIQGKQALLEFFEYLDGSAALFQDLQGKKALSLFFLDKDVDDLTGRLRNSPHIVYTEHYEVENYVFMHGDIVRAAANAASLDLAAIRATIGDYEPWRRRCAELWKDWVILCAYAQVHGLRSECNYSVPSRINLGVSGAVDNRLLAQYRTLLLGISGLPTNRFDLNMTALVARIDAMYQVGKYDSVFKGKWYALFLVDAVRVAARGRPYNQTALEEKLFATMTATLSFNQPWTDHFGRKVRWLLMRYGLSPTSSMPFLQRIRRLVHDFLRWFRR